MKFMRTPDDSLVDLDGIAAQVFITKPEGCKSKRAQQGECCCKEHCNLTMHYSAQTKDTIYEKQAVELGEVEGEFDDEEQTEQDAGIFQSTSLDVEAALGITNLL